MKRREQGETDEWIILFHFHFVLIAFSISNSTLHRHVSLCLSLSFSSVDGKIFHSNRQIEFVKWNIPAGDVCFSRKMNSTLNGMRIRCVDKHVCRCEYAKANNIQNPTTIKQRLCDLARPPPTPSPYLSNMMF